HDVVRIASVGFRSCTRAEALEKERRLERAGRLDADAYVGLRRGPSRPDDEKRHGQVERERGAATAGIRTQSGPPGSRPCIPPGAAEAVWRRAARASPSDQKKRNPTRSRRKRRKSGRFCECG